MVEHILYINLEYRIDRKEQIIKTLSEHFPEEIIYRIPGILNTNCPAIGIAQAHINALEHAITNDWKHVLIMEDDMIFNEFEKNYKKLRWQVLDWNEKAIDLYTRFGCDMDEEWLNCDLSFI